MGTTCGAMMDWPSWIVAVWLAFANAASPASEHLSFWASDFGHRRYIAPPFFPSPKVRENSLLAKNRKDVPSADENRSAGFVFALTVSSAPLLVILAANEAVQHSWGSLLR
jgi:hypothetical protein